MQEELERRLRGWSGWSGDVRDVAVSAVATDAFGAGEYEARLAFPPESDTPHAADTPSRLRRELEEALPRAWVVSFSLPSLRDPVNEVLVTFDYLPEGMLAAS